MINISELIAKTQSTLQKMENGLLEIHNRPYPRTWEELRQCLEDELVPLLYRLFEPLGGLHVIPHIDLPDGVVSTSWVSQSEMTQFVTNTLNVWFGALMERMANIDNNSVNRFKPKVSLIVRKSLVTLPPVQVPQVNVTKPAITFTKVVGNVYTLNVTAPVVDVVKPTISISVSTP